MACTLRLAADTAKLGQPEIALGLIPGLRRHAAAAAAGRQGQGDGDDPDRRADRGRRGAAHRPGQPRRAGGGADGRGARAGRAAGEERADRDALHHQRGEQGRRDAVRRGVPVRGDAVRSGRVDRRHARGHGGVSREAQAGVQGQSSAKAAAERAMQTIQGSGRAAGFRFAVVVSKYNDFVTDRLQAGALAALAAAGVAPSDITLVRVPGAFEIPLAALHAAESGALRRDRLPRLPDPRRDAALRVHLVGGGARADRRRRRRPACRWRSAC